MGCGPSAPPKPSVIIPDPIEPSVFALKKATGLGNDYEVRKDTESGDLWLYIRRFGSLFDEDATYVLENFQRPDNSNEGKILAVAKLDKFSVDDYRQYDSNVHDDSDSSAGSEDSDDDGKENIEQNAKWLYKGTCKFYKDKESTQAAATLRIKAKGIAKRKLQFKDNEGKEEKIKISRRVRVKKFVYKLEVDGAGGEGESNAVPVKLTGRINHPTSDGLHWESPLFDANSSGFLSPTTIVKTTDKTKDQGLSLLIGFVIARELEPNEVTKNVHIKWPAAKEGDVEETD